MKVLMVEPGKSPYAAEIESGLKSLQAAVGGDIQAVYPYDLQGLPARSLQSSSLQPMSTGKNR